jgi:dsDNA-binding SOS-regulon protein
MASPTPKGQLDEPDRSPLSRIEKAVYFRIARGFAWFLLVVVTLIIIVDAILLVSPVLQVVGSSTSVPPKDLIRAASSPSSVRSAADQGEADLNPAEMAQLDQAAYEIIKLLTYVDSSNRGVVDTVRAQIRNAAAGLSEERKEQLSILHELRDDLGEVPESQRKDAVDAYFTLKSRAIEQAKQKKAVAQASFLLYGATLVTGIALLTMVTMILVLLAIERNTRTSPKAPTLAS